MTYLRITLYLYVVAALFLFYKAYQMWPADSDLKWLASVLGIGCLAMFWVRLRLLRNMGGKKEN